MEFIGENLTSYVNAVTIVVVLCAVLVPFVPPLRVHWAARQRPCPLGICPASSFGIRWYLHSWWGGHKITFLSITYLFREGILVYEYNPYSGTWSYWVNYNR